MEDEAFKLAFLAMVKAVACVETQDLKSALCATDGAGISIKIFFLLHLEFGEDVFEDVLVAHEMEGVFGVIQLLISFGGIE